MVEMRLPSEILKREAQRSAIATLRQSRAQKTAWEEDNKQRKKDDKPTRTLLQYKGDLDPPLPSPPSPQNELKAKLKMLNPHEPQTDRLPNVKIPLAKTDRQHRQNRQKREEMAKLCRADVFRRPKTTMMASIKRRAEEHSGNTLKKPRTDVGTSTDAQRKADEQNSCQSKRLKIGSFTDYLPMAENKIKANSAPKRRAKLQSAGLENKAHRQIAGASEKSEVEKVALSAMQTDNKSTVTAATAKPATGSHAVGTKREAEELQGDATKRPRLDSASSQATVDKTAISGDTSKVVPQKQSFQDKSSTAHSATSAERCPGSESLAELAETPPLAASCEEGSPKIEIGDSLIEITEFDAQKHRSYTEFNDTQAKKENEATETSDKPKSQIEPAKTGSETLRVETKRKRDDEIGRPLKKAKLLSSNPENSLRNYRQACFINTSLHMLYSVPAFASMRNEKSDMSLAGNVLNRTKMRSAVAGGNTRTKEESCEKLRDHPKMKADRNELKLLPYLNKILLLWSADRDPPHEVNLFVFQQVCGTMFVGNDNNPMNGETQDAHEFMIKLLSQSRKEHPALDLHELLGVQFSEQQVCECGSAKTFTEEGCNFNVPEDLRSDRCRVDLRALMIKYIRDKSKFAQYWCEECGESGKWSTNGGWDGKLMTKSPEYLIANVSRGQMESRGHHMEEVKLTSKIRPPLKKLSIPRAGGSQVHYHMVAMIKHEGKNLHRGHYTAIRKIGNQWWHCDDTEKGVTPLTRAEIRNREEACIFLLKKANDQDFEEEA